MFSINELKNKEIEFDNNFTSLSNNFLLSGQSIQEWIIYFNIDIPKDVNHDTIMKLYQEIDEKYTVAYNNMIVASGILSMTKRTLNKVSSQEYIKFHNDTTVRKTAVSIEKSVDLVTIDETDSVTISEYIYDFWKGQVYQLERKQKLIENISWTLKNKGF